MSRNRINNQKCIQEASGCVINGCLDAICCSDSIEVYFLQWEVSHPYGNCSAGYPGSSCATQGGTDGRFWVCCAEGDGYAVKGYLGECSEQGCTMYRTIANKCAP